MPDDEPTQTTDKGLEIPVPTRGEWDKTLSKIAKPARSDAEIEENDEGEQEQAD
jgi:hypothetical protein